MRNFPTIAPREVRVDARMEQPLAALDDFLADFDGRVLIAADSPGRREVLHEMLRGHGLAVVTAQGWEAFAGGAAPLALTVAADLGGLTLTEPRIAIISEAQLFGARARQERRRKRAAVDPEAILRDLQDLNPGAPVVHEEYGVGRYVGLQSMEVAGQPGEFLVLEYLDGDRVYVPVQALHLVTRYTGAAPESAPLHKLGTDQWAKARKRAADQIRDVAAELLDLYARRKAQRGLRLAVKDSEYQTFANAFPFEETEDQAEAIRKVLAGPAKRSRRWTGSSAATSASARPRSPCAPPSSPPRPASRSPCSRRPRCWCSSICQLPRPLRRLAGAHRRRCRASAPPRRRRRSSRGSSAAPSTSSSPPTGCCTRTRASRTSACSSSMRSTASASATRSGCRHCGPNVHVLTLTATPIPRTLNMALGGLRDLSLITTPPAERLAIKTFVTEWHGPTLREAVLRELRRGGQVYFVHNEIRTHRQDRRRGAGAGARGQRRIGHGQMRERDLERLMVDFYHRRFDLLLCTTIIESGIDVPTANTILINRADHMGLAQLHQLRGRVGRSHHRAYAYLIAPPRKALAGDAAKRLEAIESMEELGAGFVLATHDLEIRGAGELLGEQQSGQMTEIGLAMYLDMLEHAVKALKEGREPALDKPLAAATEVELRLPAFLPEAFIGDVHVRLGLYKRIAAAASAEGLDDLTAEVHDRFGALPPPAQSLIRIAKLKLTARALGIRRLDLGPQGGSVTFEERSTAEPEAIVRLMQQAPREYRLEGPLRLRITRAMPTEEARFDFGASLMKRLAAKPR